MINGSCYYRRGDLNLSYSAIVVYKPSNELSSNPWWLTPVKNCLGVAYDNSNNEECVFFPVSRYRSSHPPQLFHVFAGYRISLAFCLSSFYFFLGLTTPNDLLRILQSSLWPLSTARTTITQHAKWQYEASTGRHYWFFGTNGQPNQLFTLIAQTSQAGGGGGSWAGNDLVNRRNTLSALVNVGDDKCLRLGEGSDSWYLVCGFTYWEREGVSKW